MKIQELGHIVFFVNDLDKMSFFYREVLGFEEISNDSHIAAFTSGHTHHELLLIKIPVESDKPRHIVPGLYHFGLKIGTTDEELQEAYNTLKRYNISVTGTTNHHVSKSIYIKDPENNEIELYIDTDADWKNNPSLITLPPLPLNLD